MYLFLYLVTKNDLNRPPNLSQFKSKIVQSLKNKQSNHDKAITNLEKERKLELDHFMEDRSFEEEIEEEVEQVIVDQQTSHETYKHYKEMKKLLEACDIIL